MQKLKVNLSCLVPYIWIWKHILLNSVMAWQHPEGEFGDGHGQSVDLSRTSVLVVCAF